MITDLINVMLFGLRAEAEREARLKREVAKQVYRMAAEACEFTFADYTHDTLLNREGKPLTPEDTAEFETKLVACENEYYRRVEEGKQKAREAKEAEAARIAAKRQAENDLAAAPWREARIKRKLEAVAKQRSHLNTETKGSPR